MASAILLTAQNSSAAGYSGTGVGPIPDSSSLGPADYGSPLVVSFNVTNIQGSVQSIALSLTMQHPWPGDLDVKLTSPGGVGYTGTNFVIFSRLEGPPGGPEGYGCSIDLNGTYIFNDAAPGTLSTTADQIGRDNSLIAGSGEDYTYVIPSGTYRTSITGPFVDQASSLATDSGFIGLPQARANGIWTLTFRDGSAGDSGSVSAATLFLNTAVVFTTLTTSNNVAQLNLSGPLGQSFRVWSSTNMAAPFPASWNIVATNTFGLDGTASVTADASQPSGFYRASAP